VLPAEPVRLRFGTTWLCQTLGFCHKSLCPIASGALTLITPSFLGKSSQRREDRPATCGLNSVIGRRHIYQVTNLLHIGLIISTNWCSEPKASAQPVGMGALLADIMRHWQQETPYSKPEDWVFPSFRLRGRKPRTGSIMAQDYLRPAAVKAGILAPEDRRRFGFHNLRHSLASYLVTQTKTDVKTVQSMLRHSDIGTTLDIYPHAINKDKLAVQNQVMEAMLKPGLVN
jgi:hypothetical protein